jgi:hypothetical protein
MRAASQCCVSAFHQEASNTHVHREERAAVWLDQRPFLTFFPLNEEHELRVHLLRDSKHGLAI